MCYHTLWKLGIKCAHTDERGYMCQIFGADINVVKNNLIKIQKKAIKCLPFNIFI